MAYIIMPRVTTENTSLRNMELLCGRLTDFFKDNNMKQITKKTYTTQRYVSIFNSLNRYNIRANR